MADVAVLGLDIDSSDARGAAKDLLRFNQAALDATKGVDKLERSQSKLYRNEKGQFISSADAAERYGNEVERLANKYNATLSSQIAFQREQEELNRAVQLGVLTQEQYQTALASSAARMQTAAVAGRTLAASQQQSAHHVANLSFQLNDIGMMMASGQAPFMLMIQQGPQVAQVLSQITAQGQRIGPTLVSAFRMILNPTTLVTLALIGGAAALFQWARGGEDAASSNEKLTESLGGLAESAQAYSQAIQTANQTAPQLVEQFGLQAGHLQRIYDLNVQLQRIGLEQSIRASALAAQNVYGGLADQLEYIDTLTRDATSTTYRQLEATANLRDAMESFTEQTGLGYGQAVNLNRALQAMAEADTMAEQAAAAESFVEELVKAHDAGATIPPELLAIAREAGVAAEAIAQIESAARGSASGVRELGAAWAGVMSIIGQTSETGTPITTAILPGSGLGDRPPGRPTDIDFGIPAGSGGGRSGAGGGGGGASAINDDFQRRYEALQNGFKSEFDLTVTEYQRQQETLEQALSRKLITEQEYQRNKQLLYLQTFGTEAQQNVTQFQLEQEALQTALNQKLITYKTYYEQLKALQFDYYTTAAQVNQNGLAADLGRTSQYFGQLVSLTGSSFDTLARLQQSFAASQALVNAYLAASQALADPRLGFWAKMAAYGKVLAAGLGLVSAIKGAGGGSSASSGAASSAQGAAQTQAPPQREVLVRLEGDDWLVGMADNLLNQIYEQSKDGRVIVARDR